MKYHFPEDFFFGVSNAAGQVEDHLEDTWIKFARKGGVRCFENVPAAEKRLEFWTHPEIELDLARDLGVKVFRLSLAWERVNPAEGVWDEKACERYREILKMIKARGMKVMLTLFHHAVPPWFQASGGWPCEKSPSWFQFYSQKAFQAFSGEVDYWITLNEPTPWSFLTYTEGLFPPGIKGSWSAHQKSLKNMAKAHRAFYTLAQGKAPIGIAHHMGLHVGRGFFNQQLTKISDYLAHWQFLKSINDSMDFFGINYYGAEWMTLKGPAQYDDLEYSDAGRAVCPQGLLILLRRIHQKFPKLPILITENGVGDSTDQLRGAYLLEHLSAILQAIKEGIPVKGYVHWTLTDNLEWSDGYGPKFGLVAVDRENHLKRIPRYSFALYQHIIDQHAISQAQREECWKTYWSHVGQPRPYWRATNGKSGLDRPKDRLTPAHDWRLKVFTP